MGYELGPVLYEGKAKTIHEVKESDELVAMVFKNHLTAFNGKKFAELDGKGEINCLLATFIFDYLKKNGIESHHVETTGTRTMVVKKLSVIPLEVVVRNRLAGSLAKKFNKEEGEYLPAPLVEFFFKDDELGDPFVSEDQITALGLVDNPKYLPELKSRH
ncbi:MAG: phosphoribosylaminoimidazolesuccinocarboxamide synthase [Bdellovibrionales bacterium]